MAHLRLPRDFKGNQWFNEGKLDSFHKDLRNNSVSPRKNRPVCVTLQGFKEILTKVTTSSSYIFWEFP